MVSIILLVTNFCLLYCRPAASTKPFHSGQRIFTDAQSIDFIDPAKHGFHIVLRDHFVATHLQPIHAPTVYASAIALQQNAARSHSSKLDNRSAAIARESETGALRTTKTLYPENGNPDDGLLDGRTIKLLGLKEKTWYYVCVEFESNLRRHELVTGLSCQLKRTLDKFGQSVESIVNEIEMIEITDRSIAVRLIVNTDFPLFLHVYLNPDQVVSPPAQTFYIGPQEQNQRLLVFFGPFLQADTLYGKICVIEEPAVEIYTAMGRSIRTTMENCYFDQLKTKFSSKISTKKFQQDSPSAGAQAQLRAYQGGVQNRASSTVAAKRVLCLSFAIVTLIYFLAGRMLF